MITTKGVFSWHLGDFRAGASSDSGSLLWLYICLHVITRETPRREFTPVVVPGRELH